MLLQGGAGAPTATPSPGVQPVIPLQAPAEAAAGGEVVVIPVTGADLSWQDWLAEANLQPVLDGAVVLAALAFMLYGLARYLKR